MLPIKPPINQMEMCNRVNVQGFRTLSSPSHAAPTASHSFEFLHSEWQRVSVRRRNYRIVPAGVHIKWNIWNDWLKLYASEVHPSVHRQQMQSRRCSLWPLHLIHRSMLFIRPEATYFSAAYLQYGMSSTCRLQWICPKHCRPLYCAGANFTHYATVL